MDELKNRPHTYNENIADTKQALLPWLHAVHSRSAANRSFRSHERQSKEHQVQAGPLTRLKGSFWPAVTKVFANAVL
eukprot:3303640-Rhodomonas_salina.1